jgi:hypothetical protein
MLMKCSGPQAVTFARVPKWAGGHFGGRRETRSTGRQGTTAMAQERGPQQAYARKYGEIVAKAWTDPAFKRPLLANRAAVLEEHSLPVPRGVELKAVGVR